MESAGTETRGEMVTDPRSITDLGDFVDSLVASAKGTIRGERDHLTFMLAKNVAETLRRIAGSIAAFVLYGLALLIASIGGAIWLGRELGDVALGFGCVALLFLVLGVVFGALWKQVWGKRFVVNLINDLHGH